MNNLTYMRRVDKMLMIWDAKSEHCVVTGKQHPQLYNWGKQAVRFEFSRITLHLVGESLSCQWTAQDATSQ